MGFACAIGRPAIQEKKYQRLYLRRLPCRCAGIGNNPIACSSKTAPANTVCFAGAAANTDE
jgi:hypothetical protein